MLQIMLELLHMFIYLLHLISLHMYYQQATMFAGSSVNYTDYMS